jgi:hypothetical protein
MGRNAKMNDSLNVFFFFQVFLPLDEKIFSAAAYLSVDRIVSR